MTTTEQILLIILGVFLALFLLLGITLLIMLIKLIKTVRRLTEKAERLADKAEAVGDFFQHASGPLALGKSLAGVAEMFFKRGSKRKS